MNAQFQAFYERIEQSGGFNLAKIRKAYEFAEKFHEGQTRISGEQYIIHPLAVAEIVVDLKLDTDSICAALLHDTIEDNPENVDINLIKREFGKDIAEIVDGVTKLMDLPDASKEENNIESLRKMFLAMSKDLRVIFIKLADRLHNMRTLNYRSEGKQRSVALETMHVYAPLANRLGIQKIKQELEILALKYLDPIGFEEVERDIEKRLATSEGLLLKAQNQVAEALTNNNIKHTIEGRVKSIYSIYKKMFNQSKSFNEIYDFYAIRVITENTKDCYNVLCVIHELFNSVPGRFKDYISTPKPNLYRSLHTTVIGRDGVPFEVQIRSEEMHEVAEYGLAAHWTYKTGEQTQQLVEVKLGWIRTLLETEKEDDLDEFFRPLKVDLFEDETFVFTPKGDVISLPSGSTPIDFAYAIHSAVGNKMVGAKVNGNIVPIDYKLEHGQIVEILTSAASKGPSRDWFKIVRSGEAHNKIRQFFKKEMRHENIVIGKLEVERELKRYGRHFTEAQKNEIIKVVATRSGLSDVDDLYNNIGYGGIAMSKIAPKIKDEFDRVVHPLSAEEQALKAQERFSRTGERQLSAKAQSVIIDSVEGCEVKFAKCCNPLPGDTIIGFITKGFGVSIHKYECQNAVAGLKKAEDKDRWVVASWSERVDRIQPGSFEAILNIYTNYSQKTIADVTVALTDMKVAITSIQSKENGDIMLLIIGLRCSNIEHLKNIISNLKKLKNIRDVVRG